MIYTVNEFGNVEVKDIGITDEERRKFEEIDALWEVMEQEGEEAQD